MPIFEYHAIDNTGRKIKGKIDADTVREARDKIKSLGQTPLKVSVDKSSGGGGGLGANDVVKSKLRSLSLKEKIDFTKTFQTLNKAGLPIIESLIFMEQNASTRQLRLLAQEIRLQVISGLTYSDTIARYPDIFGQVYIGLTKAGEDTGEMEKTLDRIIGLLQKQGNIKARVVSTLTYPCIVIVLAICVVLVMLMFVFPAFKDMFDQTGKALPAITQFCMDAGDFLKDKWFFIPLFIIGLVFLIRFLFKNPVTKRRIDEIVLAIPLVSDLIKTAAFSNFLTVLQVGYEAGIPIIDSLYLANLTFENSVMNDAIKVTIKKMQQGAHLSLALKASKLFPKMVLFMISTGEQSGQLGDLMSQCVMYIDQQLDAVIDTLTKMLEPLLMIVIGSIVCFLALSLYLPLFQSYAQ